MTEHERSPLLALVCRAWLVLAAMLAFCAVPAAAHLTPNSELRLHFEPGAVRVGAVIPAGEFSYATGLPLSDRPGDLRAAGRYLLAHAGLATPAGEPWRGELERIAVVQAPGGPDLTATVRFIAPPQASDRQLFLRWTAVIERSPDHFALVAVVSDLAAGIAEGHDLLGTLTATRPAMTVDRGAGAPGGLFGGALRLGAHHILVGHDHLLFLLALLLPAPLVAARGRWSHPKPPGEAVRALGWVVTAFTLGHSVTLIAAALFALSLPAPPVEAAIALSVLLSAIHAWRPLFAGREPWVAAGFGLIHGLAFATVVTGFGAGAWTRATAILGFNLGIELIQLALVAALLPGLLIGASSRFYESARLALCTVTALAALAWLAERLSGEELAIAAGFATVLPLVGLLLVTVSLALGLAHLRRRLRPAMAIAVPGAGA